MAVAALPAGSQPLVSAVKARREGAWRLRKHPEHPQQQRISRSASTRRRDETFSIPTSVPSRMPALPTLLYAQGCKVATTQSKGESLSTKANLYHLRSAQQQATNKSPSYQRHVSSTNPSTSVPCSLSPPNFADTAPVCHPARHCLVETHR